MPALTAVFARDDFSSAGHRDEADAATFFVEASWLKMGCTAAILSWSNVMNYCDRERNRILNELEMVSQVANQIRLSLATNDLDREARERAEQVLMRQKREMKMLSSLLSQIDAGVSVLLKA
jgi:hypothetical protein